MIGELIWWWLAHHLGEYLPSIVLAGLIIGLSVLIQKVTEKRRT